MPSSRPRVAPPLDWVLCLVVGGSLMMAEGPFVRSDMSGHADGLQLGLGFVRTLAGLYGGIVVGKLIGRALAGRREERLWRERGRTEVLRPAARPPGTSITREPDGLVVRDPLRRHVVADASGLSLQRYDVAYRAKGATRGLLVRDPDKVALDVPGEFDADEVGAFAARIHAEVLHTETDPRQLPVRPKGGRVPVLRGAASWRRGAGVLQGLLYAAPALALVAVLRWVGLVPMPEWLAWELGGLALLLPGGWLLARVQLPAWVRDPASVPEPH